MQENKSVYKADFITADQLLILPEYVEIELTATILELIKTYRTLSRDIKVLDEQKKQPSWIFEEAED